MAEVLEGIMEDMGDTTAEVSGDTTAEVSGDTMAEVITEVMAVVLGLAGMEDLECTVICVMGLAA